MRKKAKDIRLQTWDFLPVIRTNPVNLMNPLNLLNPFTGSLSESEHNPSTQPPDPQGRAPLNFFVSISEKEMAVLKISGLSKSFGIKTVFENVSFEVRSGERVGLVGANGAGKTTLLKCIMGLRRPIRAR